MKFTMLGFFRRKPDNPWLEQDRQAERKTIVTVVAITLVVASGIGFLIYALTHD